MEPEGRRYPPCERSRSTFWLNAPATWKPRPKPCPSAGNALLLNPSRLRSGVNGRADPSGLCAENWSDQS